MLNPDDKTQPVPWRVGEALDHRVMDDLRRDLAITGFKWDPQVGDTSVLADRPVIIAARIWDELAGIAESLEQERLDAERAILERPRLLARLDLPSKIVRILRSSRTFAIGPRVSRYDFHWTDDLGWQISEVNSDVPGGYVEASTFTTRFAQAVQTQFQIARTTGGRETAAELTTPPCPVHALVRSILAHASSAPAGPVALVHATAYADDAQVMHLIAQQLRNAGRDAVLCAPDAVFTLFDDASFGRPSHIIRFYPAEWLCALPQRTGWRRFFTDDTIPQTNPATSLVTQSKRWPIFWNELATDLPAWRRHCPPTNDIEPIYAKLRDDHVYKPTLGRVGDGVIMHPDQQPPRESEGKEQARARRDLVVARIRRTLRRPPGWISQRRFNARGIEDSAGIERALCLGVFVIGQKAAGVYARLATDSWVHHAAKDVAVLVEHDRCAGDDVDARSARTAGRFDNTDSRQISALTKNRAHVSTAPASHVAVGFRTS